MNTSADMYTKQCLDAFAKQCRRRHETMLSNAARAHLNRHFLSGARPPERGKATLSGAMPPKGARPPNDLIILFVFFLTLS